MQNDKASTNEHLTDEQLDRRIHERMAVMRVEARRARNLDRAIVIVARLMFEGCILMDVNSMYGQVFEDSVTVVLDLLERFQLDSQEGEIIDIFGGTR